jgi:acetamidase/formamidase
MAHTTLMARVKRDQYHYAVGPDISPAIEITPGQEVVVETMDCFTGAITNSAQRFNSVADLLKVMPGLNPVSGPIAVTGAEPRGRCRCPCARHARRHGRRACHHHDPPRLWRVV